MEVVVKLAILTACALATIASAAAKDAPHVLIPQAQWQKFRDQVILPGKCPDYFEPGFINDDPPEEQLKELDECWLKFGPHA